MILYIYISKVKNIETPPTYIFLIRKFYMTQLNRICRPTKKELGFWGHKLKWRCLLYFLFRLYKQLKQLDFHKFITFYYIFYNNCHVINKSHVINVLSPLKKAEFLTEINTSV